MLVGAGLGAAALGIGMGVAAPSAEAVTTTNDYFSVLFYGATGNGTTDDTAAVQAAITAAQTHGGGTVYFPAGQYLLKGSGAQLLLVQKQIKIVGDGRGSTLLVDPTVPSTTDVIRLSPPPGGAEGFGWSIDGIQIMAKSGTPARHALNIDITAAGQFMSKFLLQNCFFEQLGGRSVFLTNPSNVDGLFTSTITNNFFVGGMSLLRAGDSINIIGNTFTGANAAMDLSQVVGAANIVIAYNNITSAGGAVQQVGNADQLKIMYNQIEQTVANPTASMIYLNNSSYTEIVGNNMNSHGNSLYNIVVQTSSYAKIRDNIISPGTATAIYILASSDHTEVGYNNYGPGQVNDDLVTDQGIATIGVLRTLTLTNGWVNADTVTFGFAGARKQEDGTVRLSGVIASGTVGATVCTLPTGFRPQYQQRFSVAQESSGSADPGQVDVQANGNVVVLTAGTTYVSLGGITFQAS